MTISKIAEPRVDAVAASISDTGPYDADRELVGQGLASVASGFFGGMPATDAISHVPLAALSGVLMVTAVRMVSVSTMRAVVGSSRSDTVVFVVTAIVTVSVDLIVAVAIGIVVAAFFALRNLAKSGGVNREELPLAQPGDEHSALFRLDGALFFGAAHRVLERVASVSGVLVVVLRLSQLQVLDATGARVITEMIRQRYPARSSESGNASGSHRLASSSEAPVRRSASRRRPARTRQSW